MAKTTYKAGDKVRIISTDAALCGFSIGDVVKITKSKHDGSKTSGRHTFELDRRGFCNAEQIELVPPKPTKKQRLTTLEQKVEAMQAEIDSLKAAQKVTVSAPNFTVKSEADIAKIASELAKMFAKEKKLTPNKQRKAIIAEAKAFVEKTLAEVDEQMGWQTTSIPVYKECGRLRIEFITDVEKRTAVALARFGNVVEDTTIHGKGIAKCAPDDVFNADIGKAIALGRALGLDVTKFEKAVQPSDVVEGMVVIHTEDEDVYTIEGVYEGNRYDMRHTDGDYFEKFPMTDSIENFYDILNDTEAQY